MRLRALVMDDSRVMRNMVMDALRKTELAEFEFIEAADGADGLSKFDPGLIDIAFIDWNMPRMNGFEFLDVIKADSVLKRIPVVILTTSETEQNIMESYDLGAAGYFVKPVDYKHFVEVMKTVQMYWTLNRFPNNERLPVSADAL